LGLALLLALIVVRSAPSLAQIEGFEITTDELFEDKREARIIARGNVEIRYFGEILQADDGHRERSSSRKRTARSREPTRSA
jgi:hypothetical protein